MLILIECHKNVYVQICYILIVCLGKWLHVFSLLFFGSSKFRFGGSEKGCLGFSDPEKGHLVCEHFIKCDTLIATDLQHFHGLYNRHTYTMCKLLYPYVYRNWTGTF